MKVHFEKEYGTILIDVENKQSTLRQMVANDDNFDLGIGFIDGETYEKIEINFNFKQLMDMIERELKQNPALSRRAYRRAMLLGGSEDQ